MERIALFVVIASLLAFGFTLLRRWQVRRVARTAAQDALLASLRPGVPTIVYFASPHCAPCRTQQKPILRALQAELGEGVQIVEVNALEDTEAASRWGVFSVPTTFVLDGQGTPREVNYGVARLAQLKRQLQKLEGVRLSSQRTPRRGDRLGTP